MPSITNMNLFFAVIIGVLLVNLVLLLFASYFRSKKPSKNGNSQEMRRSVPLAWAFILLVVLFDAAFIVWLVFYGKPFITEIFGLDFIDSLF
jgi:heme/copper-type cytochrome/quinol oxidase subunit 2